MLLDQYTVIYGGSFNPPHMGHHLVCMWLLKALHAGEVYVVPTYEHNLGKNLVSFEHRIKMCELMRSNFGNEVLVEDIEKHLPTPNTTYNLLKEYRRAYGITKKKSDDQLAFVIGSDLLVEIPQWYRWKDLPNMAKFVVVDRAGCGKTSAPFPVVEYPIILPSTSSSEIRNRIANGQSIDGLVPYKVAEYIKKHRLYRG